MTLTEVGRVLNMTASDVLYYERRALETIFIALANDPDIRERFKISSRTLRDKFKKSST
jgi:hypothetical protein